MTSKHIALIATSTLLLAGCANVTHGVHYATFDGIPNEVCIVKNPRVTIANALSAIQNGFERRSVRTHLVEFSDDCPCAYTEKSRLLSGITALKIQQVFEIP